MADCACDVAHRRPRHHGAEGAYLRDMILAVFLLRVRDHVVAPVVGDIHIYVRRFRAFRIEESLERKFIEEGVHVRDAGEVRDQTAGGRAARGSEDALAAGEPEQVGDDEVVYRETLINNDFQLVLNAVCDFFCFLKCAGRDASIRLCPQFFIMVLKTRRYGNHRERPFPKIKGYVAAIGDFPRIVNGVGIVLEQGERSFLADEREVLVLISAMLALLDAPHGLSRFAVIRFQIIDIVLSDKRSTTLTGKCDYFLHEHFMAFDLWMMRNLQVHVLVAKYILELCERGGRAVLVARA